MKAISTDMFILTSEWEDLRNRHEVRFYGVSNAYGPLEVIFDNQRPLFFIPRRASLPEGLPVAERKAVSLQDFAGGVVDALYFTTQSALIRVANRLRRVGIDTYEADVKPDRRFLMERFIHAQASVQGKAVQKKQLLSFRNPRFTPCEIIPLLSVASLDIETGKDNKILYSIAVHITGRGSEKKRVFMLGEEFTKLPKNISLYPSEKTLLEAFFNWFKLEDPDIIIGWHVVGFDLRFLESKCRECRVPFELSRSGRKVRLYKRKQGGYEAEVSGRVVIDGPKALRAAFYNFEDFRLETVARALLDRGKEIGPEQDKVAEIERLFREDKAALAGYNLEDCILVSRIFEQTALLNLYLRRSQISGLLLNQVGMSVAAFDHLFLPRLHRKGYVAPMANVKRQKHAPGGYVFSPTPGIYDDVIVLDFKSLYPSIIQSFKIDPLSLLKNDRNPIITPGEKTFRFSATEHILPEIITRLMAQRQLARRKRDAPLSHAIKILMNSFYGVMGTAACRFYDPVLPAAITGIGQWLLQGCKESLEIQGYTVLYGDTDSVFVKLKPAEAAIVNTRGPQLAEMLNEYWRQELKKRGVNSFLEMEYEKYYRKFVLPLARAGHRGARKRYAGILLQGTMETLEFVGMEYVRSDWTPLAKEFQYQLYERVLKGKDYRNWINDVVRRVRSGELDPKLVYFKRLRKDVREYTKNVAPQVRAARMLAKPGRDVRYVMTPKGPLPLELHHGNIDYQHYINKQLKPVADSILKLIDTSFEELIIPKQMRLFR